MGKIDINSSSLEELLTLKCVSLSQAKSMKKRIESQVFFEDLEEVVGFLNLKPHEREELLEKAIVLAPPKSIKGRIVDF